MKNLWPAVMLMGIYSFLGATWMLILDSPDVAFTEAAVGAGISTILALATLSLTTTTLKRPTRINYLAIAVVIVTGSVLVYGTFDMPYFGDPEAPPHLHPSPSYVELAPEEVGVPNIVTAVLSSYRGYDTLGETVVVLTAGLGVLILLRGRARRRVDEEPE